MEQTDRITPPYTAFASVKTLVKNLQEHGLPSRVDRSVLGGSFSNAVGSQILTAIKFLRLIDGANHPNDRFKTLTQAYGTDNWGTVLGSILRDAYTPLFSLNLETASPSQFNELFGKTYPGTDDVKRKSITFFLNAARDAGIKISPYIEKNKKPRATPAKKKAPKPASAGDRERGSGHQTQEHDQPPIIQRSTSQVVFDAFDPTEMPPDVQQATLTLLTYLKTKGL